MSKLLSETTAETWPLQQTTMGLLRVTGLCVIWVKDCWYNGDTTVKRAVMKKVLVFTDKESRCETAGAPLGLEDGKIK